jgi:hypothetical protein
MEKTLTIQIKNQKAMAILHELDQLHLIKVLKKSASKKIKLSDKYKGIISKAQGADLNEHIKVMRSEWSNI